jgi:type VI secretion system protein ImpG
MNSNLLKYFNNELQYLREAGEKFAIDYPQVAKQLGIKELTTADPYIERLLEGFAFLAARVHYQLDSEFENFTQTLIDTIYPDYFMPFPSASIVKFTPEYSDKDLSKGIKIPRNTELKTKRKSITGTGCTFRTTQDVILWPFKISNVCYDEKVEYWDPLQGTSSKSMLCIELNTCAKIKFSDLKTSFIDFYISGTGIKTSTNIYEILFTKLEGIDIEFNDEKGELFKISLSDIKTQLKHMGFDDEHAMMPNNLRAFSGYRLLKEFFCFPKKFLFFRLDKLYDALKQIDSDLINIKFTFKHDDKLAGVNINQKNFSLFATPVINLFEKVISRFPAQKNKKETIIHADRAKLFDYEIIKINKVFGYNDSNIKTLEFSSFYKVNGTTNNDFVFYKFRRNLIPKDFHARKGTDMFFSIGDVHTIQSSESINDIEVSALCSNRMLPYELNLIDDSKNCFNISCQYPVSEVKFIEQISEPDYSTVQRSKNWSVVNHLFSNYMNIVGENIEQNVEIVKNYLKLYSSNTNVLHERYINGIISFSSKREIITIECSKGVSFGNGINIELLFNENSYKDSGFIILARVIKSIVSRNLPINTVLKLTVGSNIRGKIVEWNTHPY